MSLRKLVACCLALTSLVGASPTKPLLPRAILKPRDDPFYALPGNIESLKPGDIIRTRNTPGPIGAAQQYTSANIQASYQLLYRTTDALGKAEATVVTIIVPHNPSFDKVLAYEAAYDSSDPNCSPSYSLQQKSNNTQYDPLFMAAALNQGWVIATADYEGRHAQFVSGLMSGQATLDSIRAALQSGSVTGIKKNATYTLWGYSGGALASEWAIELQPLYAPELKIAGAAFGGLTPNVVNVVNSVNNGPFSWQTFAGINGLSAAYPNLSDYINTVKIPSKFAQFQSINYLCTNDTNSENDLSFKDLFSYTTKGRDVLNDPVAQSVIKWGATMGLRSTPTTPVYLYKAVGDEISPVADTDAIVKKYCAAGASIEYSRNFFGEHVTEAILGSGSAFTWLKERMNGVPAKKGCSTENVFISAPNADALEGFGEELIGVLTLLFGQPLGPASIKGL